MSTSLSRLQQFYSDLDPVKLLRVMIGQEFSGRIASFSSFGSYSALLLSFVAEVDPATPVLFLETRKHFPETLEFVEQVRERLGLTDLRLLTPDPEIEKNIDPDGTLWQSNVNRCCWMRKVEPLERELSKSKIEAVITGRRSYQTPERSIMQRIELDEHERFRINPLAFWSKEDIKIEFNRRNLPQHPLVGKGYPSIGCAPCTLPVTEGEDERSGRWKNAPKLLGKQKTECGIHVAQADSTGWTV